MLAAAAACVRGFTAARAKVLKFKYRGSLDDGPAQSIDGRANAMDMTETEDITLPVIVHSRGVERDRLARV